MSHTSDITLLYLIKQVELAVRSRLDEAVMVEGLTSLQYTALTVLQRKPGLTSAELARNSFVRPQTMAQMTTFLEDHAFVRRERDPRNKRQVLLFLTEDGALAVERLAPLVAKIEAEMIDGLDEAEVRAFRSTLISTRKALGGVPAH